MTIYGEYLFLENLITTFLLLVLTSKLAGRIPRRGSLLASSLLGACSSFIIFLPLDGILSSLVRIALGTLCVLIAFGTKQLLQTMLLYHVLTFASGGMVMALFLWMQTPVISHQGIIYMETITYLRLVLWGTLAFGVTYWFVKFVRKSRVKDKLFGKVTIIFEGNTYSFKAFVDSGNSLREPISGSPVVLLDSKGASRMDLSIAKYPQRYGVIPFKAVGAPNGTLMGFRCDRLIFDNKSKENVYVALFDGDFEDFDVLMHKDFLEGGLLQNEY